MEFQLNNKLPNAAAVQWANIKPEFNPPSFTKNAGNSLKAKTYIFLKYDSLIVNKARDKINYLDWRAFQFVFHS